jgi:hypothetical protein
VIPTEEVDARHEIRNHNSGNNKEEFIKEPPSHQYVGGVCLNQKFTMNVRFQKLRHSKQQSAPCQSNAHHNRSTPQQERRNFCPVNVNNTLSKRIRTAKIAVMNRMAVCLYVYFHAILKACNGPVGPRPTNRLSQIARPAPPNQLPSLPAPARSKVGQSESSCRLSITPARPPGAGRGGCRPLPGRVRLARVPPF